jgi:hypothetical protein
MPGHQTQPEMVQRTGIAAALMAKRRYRFFWEHGCWINVAHLVKFTPGDSRFFVYPPHDVWWVGKCPAGMTGNVI